MEEHEQAIVNLRSDLEVVQAEKKNLLAQNIELSQSLSSAKEAIKQFQQKAPEKESPQPPVEPQQQVKRGDTGVPSESGSSAFSLVDYEVPGVFWN